MSKQLITPLAPLLLTGLLLQPATAWPGSACVVAKEQGNSLAIEWTLGAATVDLAIEQTKQSLHQQGYEYVFPQANSDLQQGWMIIVQTQYTTRRNRLRTSYGCGFHPDATVAEQLALSDLRAYSWGWKPEMGYSVFQKLIIDPPQPNASQLPGGN